LGAGLTIQVTVTTPQAGEARARIGFYSHLMMMMMIYIRVMKGDGYDHHLIMEAVFKLRDYTALITEGFINLAAVRT
jgi:hypothetical protein